MISFLSNLGWILCLFEDIRTSTLLHWKLAPMVVNNTDFPCGLEKRLQSPIVIAGASSLFKMMKPINISDDDDLVKKF